MFTGLSVPQYVCHQCLCPHGNSSHSSASPGDSPRPAGGSSPGSYQVTAFALRPSVHEALCVPFESKVSISPSPVGLLQLSPIGLQSQMLWGLVFLVPDPQAGEPDMELRTLIPVGEPLQSNYSPVCGLPTLRVGMGFDYSTSLRLLPISLWFLLYVFSCRSFLVGSNLFHRWWFCR